MRVPKTNQKPNERSVIDTPIRSTLSADLAALIDEYEFAYACAGSRLWFSKQPTLAAIAEVRSFLDELTDEIIKEQM